MKFILIIIAALSISVHGAAQGKSQEKQKEKKHTIKQKKSRAEKRDQTTGRFVSHQPKKVQAALLRDYPSATNISWRKHKGDYYATFNSGVWRSTAVYHANGDRRDTRTVITRDQLPGNVWEDIFRRDNISPSNYERIEVPSTGETIFRILTGNRTSYFYDASGRKVFYAY